MDSVLRKSLEQALKKFLVHQQDDFSCGPACLATIAGLEGLGSGRSSYDYFRGLLAPLPFIGSHPLTMVEAARRDLPFSRAGEGIYNGGLALGYIVYEDNVKGSLPDEEEIDHYVVFLAKKDNQAVYYDPWDNALYNRNLSGMKLRATREWLGIDNRIENWAATFETPKWLTFDFCSAAVIPHARDNVTQSKKKDYSFVPV